MIRAEIFMPYEVPVRVFTGTFGPVSNKGSCCALGKVGDVHALEGSSSCDSGAISAVESVRPTAIFSGKGFTCIVSPCMRSVHHGVSLTEEISESAAVAGREISKVSSPFQKVD